MPGQKDKIALTFFFVKLHRILQDMRRNLYQVPARTQVVPFHMHLPDLKSGLKKKLSTFQKVIKLSSNLHPRKKPIILLTRKKIMKVPTAEAEVTRIKPEVKIRKTFRRSIFGLNFGRH